MLVPCYVRLGYYGTEQRIGRLRINENDIGIASTFCGSYHILVMGRHYRDYFVNNIRLSFPPCAGLPLAHPYVELGHKTKSTSVTGNVGEAVAGIVGRRVLGLNVNEIVHIKPKSRKKAPDYMFRAGHRLPGNLDPVFPTPRPHPLPTWWPVESKARATRAITQRTIQREAFVQLAAFWHTIRMSFPNDVGFGLAIGLACEKNISIDICVFLPCNHSGLLAHLNSKKYADYIADIENDKDTTTRGCLYGC